MTVTNPGPVTPRTWTGPPRGIRRLRAFTLIELIVVIVILGLLATIGAVSYKAVIDRTQTAALTATGQQFLKEAQALAAGAQADPATVSGVAAEDLPDDWEHTQGSTDAHRVRLTRDDGAWICAVLPADYTTAGFVSGVGMDAAPEADSCPTTPLSSATDGADSPTPTPTVSLTPLVAPTSVVATRASGSVTLTWEASTGATSYRVMRNGTQVGETPATTFTDTTDVVNADAYAYQVIALAGAQTSPAAEAPVAPLNVAQASVSGGYQHTVALKPDGSLFTWGVDNYGQLGDGGANLDKNVPVRIRSDLEWASVSGGMYHTAAVTADGRLFTWGQDTYGQLGDGGTNTNQTVPVQIRSDLEWASVYAGYQHTVALTTDGRLFTWGADSNGQLGDGATLVNKTAPVQVRPDLKWASAYGAGLHTTAVTEDGRLFTWGADSNGQLGDGGTNTNQPVPVQIRSDLEWASAVGGAFHTAAVTTDGRLFTWGQDTYGQLGDGLTNTDKNAPVQIRSDLEWASAFGGYYHTAAVTTDGRLFTWGYDGYGQLGDGGTLTDKNIPVQIRPDLSWASVAGGSHHTAAMTKDGRLFLWGLDSNGQLGDGGTNLSHTAPVQVTLP